MWRPDGLLMGLAPWRRAMAVTGAAWSLEKNQPRLARRTAAELTFLPAVIEIVDTPASPLGRATSFAIMGLVMATLVWASLGKVDIHATAQGRIITAGKTKPVAPTEIASVRTILVRDGDHVAAGQTLIELDPAGPAADTTRAREERLEQLATAAMLHALLDGKDDIALPAGIALPPVMLAVHRDQLHHKLADHRATMQSLEHEREQKQAERRGDLADQQRLAQTVPLLSERVDKKREMVAEGWEDKVQLLEIQQDFIDRRQALETATQKLAQDDAAIADVEAKLRQSEAQFRAEALTQLADAEQKAASLAQDEAKSADRERLYRLVAPVDGTVQQLAVHSPGAVVSPAQPLLMVVPDGEGIAIEAMLQNKDVGFVRQGQKVEIKVESFPFTRYGTIPGTVMVVSSDAMQNGESDRTAHRDDGDGGGSSGSGQTDTREPSYAVRIAPLADHIHADGQDEALEPGMAVTAEIKTGKRRVISYLLDPVARYWGEGLRER